MLEKLETGLRMFVTKLFEKILAIYEQVCGGSTAEKKIDAKVWANYFGELYNYSNSTEYLSHDETCFQRKAESDDFVVFSKIVDFVSHFILHLLSWLFLYACTNFSLLMIYTSNKIKSFLISIILYSICMFQTKCHHIHFQFHNNYNKIFKYSFLRSSYSLQTVFSLIHNIEPLLKSISMHLNYRNRKAYVIYTDIFTLVLI